MLVQELPGLLKSGLLKQPLHTISHIPSDSDDAVIWTEEEDLHAHRLSNVFDFIVLLRSSSSKPRKPACHVVSAFGAGRHSWRW